MTPLTIQISTFILLVLSVGLHEAAHARVASYFGDPTPEIDGVNTWNPIPHILRSWLWCLVIPGIAWFGAGFFIGGAFVMLNPSLMRPRRLGYLCAVSAGPGMNLLLCLVFTGLFLGATRFTGQMGSPLPTIFYWVVIYNLFLAIFNLIPIPPLDGASMLTTLVPALAPIYRQMQGFAFYILLIVWHFSPAARDVILWPVFQYGKLIVKIGNMLLV